MEAFFHTLGCKVNQYETQSMMALMKKSGFTPAVYHGGDVGEAVVVVNSCTVTAQSDAKLRKLLRKIRRESPRAVVALTGCMPQAFPNAARALTDADIVLGNAARGALPQKVAQFLADRRRIVDIPPHGEKYEPLAIDTFEEHTRAFVKIEDGCDRYCSYCAIPLARGRVRSRPLESIRRELETLQARGYREAVLVGINLTSYGREIGLSLPDAAETACEVAGLSRVRLGSLEPDGMTEPVIERLRALPGLCPQFHLSLQSGCDETLRAMNRRYTAAEYRGVCESLRRAFPGCALTTDVMVGFPGETEERFERSLAFVRETAFTKVHVFPYSVRPGTKAAQMPGQISNREKAARAREMAAAAEETRAAVLRGMVGRTVEVLTETGEEAGSAGYTAEYVPCLVEGFRALGETVRAIVTDVKNDRLLARPVGGGGERV